MGCLVFLPGAGGSRRCWQQVAGRLPPAWGLLLLGWPGFGDVPPDLDVRRLGDLVAEEKPQELAALIRAFLQERPS